MQDGQTCFKQAKAGVFFNCRSVWLALPSTRWGNSVLNAALFLDIGSGMHLLPDFGSLVSLS
jgi:hypothetical protein